MDINVTNADLILKGQNENGKKWTALEFDAFQKDIEALMIKHNKTLILTEFTIEYEGESKLTGVK